MRNDYVNDFFLKHCRLSCQRSSVRAADREHDIIWLQLLTNLALYIRDGVSLCLSDETLTVVGPFCLVSISWEVKYPTQGVNM